MIIEFLAVCVAGGIGAALRFIIDGAIRHRTPPSFPYATMIINISGSLVLGLLAGLVLGQVASHHWQLIIGTGMMGGYTTFSSYALEIVTLMRDDKLLRAMAYLLVSNAAGIALCFLGVALAKRMA